LEKLKEEEKEKAELMM
jgi:hypothetical protein